MTLPITNLAGATLLVGSGASDARLVALDTELMRSGRGRVLSGEGWTVRLAHGPAEDGCPGLPVHVQVKFGRRAVLRQNVWFRPQQVLLLTVDARAWLVLSGRRRAEAIPLGHDAPGRHRDLPSTGASSDENSCE